MPPLYGTSSDRTHFLTSNQYAAVGNYTETMLPIFIANATGKRAKLFQDNIRSLNHVINKCREGFTGCLSPVTLLTQTLVILVHHGIVSRDDLPTIFARVTGTRAPKEIGHLQHNTKDKIWEVVLFTPKDMVKGAKPKEEPWDESWSGLAGPAVTNVAAPSWEEMKRDEAIKEEEELYASEEEEANGDIEVNGNIEILGDDEVNKVDEVKEGEHGRDIKDGKEDVEVVEENKENAIPMEFQLLEGRLE